MSVPSPLQIAARTRVPEALYAESFDAEFDVVVVQVTDSSGHHPVSGYFVDGCRPVVLTATALIDALPLAIGAVDTSGLRRVAVTNWRVAEMLRRVADDCRLEVHCVNPRHPVVDHLFGLMREVTHRADRSSGPLPRVVVATDGSCRLHHQMVRGGFGWVSDEGRFGLGTVGSCSPLDAELAAIVDALRRHPRTQPVHILSDSEQALRVLAAVTEGRSSSPHPILRGLYSRLASAAKGRRVTFAHVRGHSGHPLNEAADRIAVFSRRSADYPIDERERMRRAAEIAREGVEMWCTSSAVDVA